MPSKYIRKKQCAPRDCQKIVQAIKHVKREKKTIYSVAKGLGIHYKSLYRYIAKAEERIANFDTASDMELLTFVESLEKPGGKQVVW